MGTFPKASIIVAAFNAEQHIELALTSALAQTGGDFEIIVADDASTDRTTEIVEQVGDDRVHLVRLEENGGPASARNAAIEVARGEWIAVLDADDRFEPGRLFSLIHIAETASADLIADNLWVRTAAGQHLLMEEQLDGGSELIGFPAYILDNRPTKKGAGYGYLKPVFRASFLRRSDLRYDPSLRIGEDFLLVAEMLVRGATYVRHRSAGYVYLKHEASISHRLGAAEAQAIASADAQFLTNHAAALSPAARASMVSHLESAKDAAAFASCLNAIKRGEWANAVGNAVQRPAVLSLMREPMAMRIARLRGRLRTLR